MNRNNPFFHYPNPYDFIPFMNKPCLYTRDELENNHEKYEGYFEVSIKALTPVHIVGEQDFKDWIKTIKRPDKKDKQKLILEIQKSHFYRENEIPLIPGSSIRGMLRTYIEALTNGWVGQFTPSYKEDKHTRYRGFSLFDENPDYSRQPRRNHLKNVIQPDYQPKVSGPSKNWKMDIATYLFGAVFEPPKKKKGEKNGKKEKAHTIRGRVSVEDAVIHSSDDQNNLGVYELPDVKAEAYFGSPNISASSWWYFNPGKIEDRIVQRGQRTVVEFRGSQLRGRKFYFHHYPENCREEYIRRQNYLNKIDQRGKDQRSDIYTYNAESLKKDKSSDKFRIYFENIPASLIYFLARSICPSDNIKHKLGFAKPFGFGSVDFTIHKLSYRKYRDSFPAVFNVIENVDPEDIVSAIDDLDASTFNRNMYTHKFNYEMLKRVLDISKIKEAMYLYPPYFRKYFQQPIKWATYDEDFKEATKRGEKKNFASWLHSNDSNRTGERLECKKTVSFKLYQIRSPNYKGPQYSTKLKKKDECEK